MVPLSFINRMGFCSSLSCPFSCGGDDFSTSLNIIKYYNGVAAFNCMNSLMSCRLISDCTVGLSVIPQELDFQKYHPVVGVYGCSEGKVVECVIFSHPFLTYVKPYDFVSSEDWITQFMGGGVLHLCVRIFYHMVTRVCPLSD